VCVCVCVCVCLCVCAAPVGVSYHSYCVLPLVTAVFKIQFFLIYNHLLFLYYKTTATNEVEVEEKVMMRKEEKVWSE